jgi:hypothetical protein
MEKALDWLGARSFTAVHRPFRRPVTMTSSVIAPPSPADAERLFVPCLSDCQ